MTTIKTTLLVSVTNTSIRHKTTDPDEAAMLFTHYAEASDDGKGDMARETVTLHAHTGQYHTDPSARGDDGPVVKTVYDLRATWHLVARHLGYNARLRTITGAMVPEITECIPWYVVDTSDGTEYIDASWIGDLPGLDNAGDIVSFADDASIGDRETITDALKDYVNGTIYGVERIDGYGAHLTMPGYLDQTEWSVFETEHDAIVYLVEMYEDEEAESDDGLDITA